MNRTIREGDHYILFLIGNTTYGVRSNEVKQMEMLEHITPVPNAPRAVEGVVILRGQVVPVINLRARFGLQKIPYDLKTRLVVVQSGSRVVGLIVDSAREFVTIPKESIGPPPEEVSGAGGGPLSGIANLGDRLILLINVDDVINPEGPGGKAEEGTPSEGDAETIQEKEKEV